MVISTLKEIIDKYCTDGGKVILCGHSTGGTLLLDNNTTVSEFFDNYSHRIEKIVLLSPATHVYFPNGFGSPYLNFVITNSLITEIMLFIFTVLSYVFNILVPRIVFANPLSFFDSNKNYPLFEIYDLILNMSITDGLTYLKSYQSIQNNYNRQLDDNFEMEAYYSTKDYLIDNELSKKWLSDKFPRNFTPTPIPEKKNIHDFCGDHETTINVIFEL